jgi:hypothetical protein
MAMAVLAGCFAPQYESGHLRCQPGAHACPGGFDCIAGACWRHGSGPPQQLPALWSASGGGVVSGGGAQLGLSAGPAPGPGDGTVTSTGGATLSLGFLGSTSE